MGTRPRIQRITLRPELEDERFVARVIDKVMRRVERRLEEERERMVASIRGTFEAMRAEVMNRDPEDIYKDVQFRINDDCHRYLMNISAACADNSFQEIILSKKDRVFVDRMDLKLYEDYTRVEWKRLEVLYTKIFQRYDQGLAKEQQ